MIVAMKIAKRRHDWTVIPSGAPVATMASATPTTTSQRHQTAGASSGGAAAGAEGEAGEGSALMRVGVHSWGANMSLGSPFGVPPHGRMSPPRPSAPPPATQPFPTTPCPKGGRRIGNRRDAANRTDGGWVTERATIERARAGDRTAQRDLYEANVERIYRVAFRLAGDEDLARDFTQEAFIRAFQRLGDFRGDSAFSTWLHAIAVSVALNGLRKVKRLRTRETVLDEALALGTPRRDADPDLRDRLYRAIDALPEGYRTVFVLHDVEGFTHEEIADQLGITTGGSKSQLFKARARLRRLLAPLMDHLTTPTLDEGHAAPLA